MLRALAVLAAVVAATPADASRRALAPAPGARILAGYPLAAEQTAAGVDVQVDANAWRWGDVEGVLKPVRITVTNRGERPVLVRYGQFGLRSRWGDRLDALPPYQAAGNPQVTATPGKGVVRFVLAPWSARSYGVGPDAAALPDDPSYFEEQQADGPAIPPNEDVVRRALPEGILEPGGTVSGFLYFREEPRGTPLTFVASAVDAATGRVSGDVAIPFVVR